MKRREIFGLAAVMAGSGTLWADSAANADHRLAPVVHQLDKATAALAAQLAETAHHQDDDEHEAMDEVLAVLAAGALNGQARALHELVEGGNPDLDLRIAARELDRQMATAERRILHAHVSRGVRERFRDVRNVMDDLLAGTGARPSRRINH